MSDKENENEPAVCDIAEKSNLTQIGDGYDHQNRIPSSDQTDTKSEKHFSDAPKDTLKRKGNDLDQPNLKAKRGEVIVDDQVITAAWKKEDFDSRVKIGKGTFANVFEAYCAKRKEKVALKVVDIDMAKSRGMTLDKIIMEAQMLVKCRDSDLIIRFFGSFRDMKSVSFVLELSLYGDLKQHMSNTKNESQLDKIETSKEATRQILRACVFLHKTIGIIHSDLKPGNILLFGVKPIGIKLTDFGTSILTEAPKAIRLFSDFRGGTKEYLAPELLDRSWFTSSVDVWSAGCIAYEIIMSKEPFFNGNCGRDVARQNMKNYIYRKTTIDVEAHGDECNNFFKSTFSSKYSRPMSEEILSMKWLKEPVREMDSNNDNSTAASNVSSVMSSPNNSNSPPPPTKKPELDNA